ncbi:sodium-dependent transporter [Anaerovibrio sp. RM50]|uniref:sodium-dependent transporter n=1 Tax=Anaerovibrio sp. RM50 TaxID=1200557 RepID=UPI00056955A8|nr:sodium-dependent transporter [Anaerovibrio sp. RM50]
MESRKSFGGSFGFVLAAAGSAVGLGNIWRFPYLAAKDGGGLFLLIYLILLLTFGFALLTTEIAIGRKTKQGPLTAYSRICKQWRWLGLLACLIPAIIMPYYSAIGGWVIKYFLAFTTGSYVEAAQDGYFVGFITAQHEPLVYMFLFLMACTAIILLGVNKGIEASSKIIMPALIILIIAIAIYSLTITHTDANGVTRSGMDGLAIYLIPNFEGLTFSHFMSVLVDAMGQLFFSLSVAMGIMVAYGSYVSDKADAVSSVNRIEFFDTLVSFLAGLLIIPAVFTFMGSEGLSASGPGLMFISLPKVFESMGTAGIIVGIMFFLMVLFAALTSAVSIMEAVVASFMDYFHITRVKAALAEFAIALIFGTIVCLGYNVFYFELPLPTGSTGQVLDVMDYISNSIFMPVISIGTCIMIGWVVGPKVVIDEMEKNGETFTRKYIYIAMIKYIAPVLLFILFLKSSGMVSF